MGVPSFFRWLARLYPGILVNAVEEYNRLVGTTEIPPDTSGPNPNGVEYDNLYLDMNGIIHPCAHPEGRSQPKNEDEIMLAIIEYLDRLFGIVRPRRVIYLAIDGVAPRAKMNQQRSRRFRSAMEAKRKVQIEEQIKADLIGRGVIDPDNEPEEEVSPPWDSNQITPGTPFMNKVAQTLQYYVTDRITTNPGWRGVMVILSDASVPGEGEHKIMEYIRHQHSQPGYNANTRHCLYGLDADLIMLALASHEPHFALIREDVLTTEKQMYRLPETATKTERWMHNPFQFLLINVLRDYLGFDLRFDIASVGFDLERAVDDFVLLCFFVGNDFLPHLPTLEIRENAITKLMSLYKNLMPTLGGYLTDNGKINIERLGLILKELGTFEEQILKERRMDDKQSKGRNLRMLKDKRARSKSAPPSSKGRPPNNLPLINDANELAAVRLRDSLDGKKSVQKKTARELIREAYEDHLSQKEESMLNAPEDPIRFGSQGWRERYYEAKFDVTFDDTAFFKKLRLHYLEGLQWVLYYYYQGCKSWEWYFPFHYSPFAGEIADVTDITINFPRKTAPFKPFEQLLSVLPGDSAQFLPEAYANLMVKKDSPIIDYYPEDFQIDLNGKRFEWQGVALLPFIDEKRMFKAIEGLDTLFTEEEKERNSHGDTLIICHKSHPLADTIREATSTQQELQIDSKITHIFGSVFPHYEYLSDYFPSPIQGLPDLDEHSTVCARYILPPVECDEDGNYVFKSGLKPGLAMPRNYLSDGNGRGGGGRGSWGRGGGGRGGGGRGRNAREFPTPHAGPDPDDEPRGFQGRGGGDGVDNKGPGGRGPDNRGGRGGGRQGPRGRVNYRGFDGGRSTGGRSPGGRFPGGRGGPLPPNYYNDPNQYAQARPPSAPPPSNNYGFAGGYGVDSLNVLAANLSKQNLPVTTPQQGIRPGQQQAQHGVRPAQPSQGPRLSIPSPQQIGGRKTNRPTGPGVETTEPDTKKRRM